MRLERLLIDSAKRTPSAPAVHASSGQATYAELDALANQIARALRHFGVTPGERVCIWLDKSIATVAAMQATLRIGAAYVPLDPLSPQARITKMLEDCSAAALITTKARAEQVLVGPMASMACLCTDGAWREFESWNDVLCRSKQPVALDDGDKRDGGDGIAASDEHALAYILYTSGSTGVPKGVCISHRNAWAFVEWAARAVDATATDRLSNHAPFHFDLSVFDLYVAFLVGARVFLAPTGISYVPERLVGFIREHEITIWYSVPSAITMMMESGGLLETAQAGGLSNLEPRVLIFAGEPFPVPRLMTLRAHWQQARFFNFYGPTETNVCTAYELPADIANARSKPIQSVPIGTAASGDRVWLQTTAVPIDEGAGSTEVGEVVVDGPTVMLGYWGREPHTGPYRTGDLARRNRDGQLEFMGRRDRMVKVRGHRIELGEIETLLHGHPDIKEAAIAIHGQGRLARLHAVLVSRTKNQPSLLALKRLCAEHLPRYMIVDRIHWVLALPRTGNGKLDRKRLLEPSTLS